MASGVQVNDVVAMRRNDDRFDIVRIDPRGHTVLKGSVAAKDAEARTLELAKVHDGDAWVEEYGGEVRCLNV